MCGIKGTCERCEMLLECLRCEVLSKNASGVGVGMSLGWG